MDLFGTPTFGTEYVPLYQIKTSHGEKSKLNSTRSCRGENVMSSVRFVPTAVHGVLDYVGGLYLVASPFIFGFASKSGIAVVLRMVLGVGLILYSLFTNYELGIPGLRFIPMSVHLSADFAASVALALAPFLFGYSSLGLNVWLPQVAAGMAVILLVLVSQTSWQGTYSERGERVRFAKVQ
jgi:hypothetical protein